MKADKFRPGEIVKDRCEPMHIQQVLEVGELPQLPFLSLSLSPLSLSLTEILKFPVKLHYCVRMSSRSLRAYGQRLKTRLPPLHTTTQLACSFRSARGVAALNLFIFLKGDQNNRSAKFM